MSVNEVFDERERLLVWNEIAEKTNQYKDQMIMDFGYAQGIAAMLNILKRFENMNGKEVRELYLKTNTNTDIDKMVRRLMKDK